MSQAGVGMNLTVSSAEFEAAIDRAVQKAMTGAQALENAAEQAEQAEARRLSALSAAQNEYQQKKLAMTGRGADAEMAKLREHYTRRIAGAQSAAEREYLINSEYLDRTAAKVKTTTERIEKEKRRAFDAIQREYNGPGSDRPAPGSAAAMRGDRRSGGPSSPAMPGGQHDLLNKQVAFETVTKSIEGSVKVIGGFMDAWKARQADITGDAAKAYTHYKGLADKLSDIPGIGRPARAVADLFTTAGADADKRMAEVEQAKQTAIEREERARRRRGSSADAIAQATIMVRAATGYDGNDPQTVRVAENARHAAVVRDTAEQVKQFELSADAAKVAVWASKVQRDNAIERARLEEKIRLDVEQAAATGRAKGAAAEEGILGMEGRNDRSGAAVARIEADYRARLRQLDAEQRGKGARPLLDADESLTDIGAANGDVRLATGRRDLAVRQSREAEARDQRAILDETEQMRLQHERRTLDATLHGIRTSYAARREAAADDKQRAALTDQEAVAAAIAKEQHVTDATARAIALRSELRQGELTLERRDLDASLEGIRQAYAERIRATTDATEKELLVQRGAQAARLAAQQHERDLSRRLGDIDVQSEAMRLRRQGRGVEAALLTTSADYAKRIEDATDPREKAALRKQQREAELDAVRSNTRPASFADTLSALRSMQQSAFNQVDQNDPRIAARKTAENTAATAKAAAAGAAAAERTAKLLEEQVKAGTRPVAVAG